MTIEPVPRQRTFGELGFDAFYRHNISVVYGYALRLCGGNSEQAQDLTQDAWVAFVDQVTAGRADQLDVRWLIAVARNRYIDHWRRTRKLESKLGLVWNATRDCDNDDSVTRQQVLEQLDALDEDHRIVLMMRGIDTRCRVDNAGWGAGGDGRRRAADRASDGESHRIRASRQLTSGTTSSMKRASCSSAFL